MAVRPMREYSAKEIAFYNHLFKVPTVAVPNLETKVRSSHFTIRTKADPFPELLSVHLFHRRPISPASSV